MEAPRECSPRLAKTETVVKAWVLKLLNNLEAGGDSDLTRACLDLASKVVESDKSWGRSPKTLASAIVYLVGNLQMDYEWTQKKMTKAGGSTGSGMRNISKFIRETWELMVNSEVSGLNSNRRDQGKEVLDAPYEEGKALSMTLT